MKKWMAIFVMLLSCGASVAAPTVTEPDTITVWFARHGKTWLNTLDRVQGWADSPLTDEGAQVARYLGEGLKAIPSTVTILAMRAASGKRCSLSARLAAIIPSQQSK